MDSTTFDILGVTADNSTHALDTETDHTKVVMKKVIDVLIVVMLGIIMMSLGCTMELEKLIKQIKKPLPAIIGMFLQFVIYPLLVFGIAHAFKLGQYDALGMLLLGTCPGGSFSNLITHFCSGDVVLSVCMTSLATAIATGMMPLNLFIYSRSFTTQNLKIPYVNIVIGLVLILVPVAIGMLILRKLPRIAAVIVNVGGVLGFIFIFFSTAINIYLYPQMLDADWKLWCAAIMLPTFGLAIGYVGSWAVRLTRIQCRTVGIEVSSQNFALCLTLIYVSFETKEATKIALFPLIFTIFCFCVLVIFTAVCRFAIYVRKNPDNKKNDNGHEKIHVQISTVSHVSIDEENIVNNVHV